MRKVLYLSAVSKIGGAERVVIDIASGLVKYNYFPVLVTQDEGSLTKEFRKFGGKVYILKLPAWRKGKNLIKRYFAVNRLAKIVKKENASLIHCNNYRLNPYALNVSRICGVPFVTHIHDLLKTKHIFNFSLHKTKNIIFVSEFVKRGFEDLNINGYILPNGVELEKFNVERGSFRRELNLPDDYFLVGMIAHFYKRKSHKYFIEAASLVKEKIDNVKFVIVGDNIWNSGIKRSDLEDFAKEKDVSSSIIFTGERNDIPRILADLDVFVLPSEEEAFGLVVLEAMASKTAVIINKFSGGSVELVEDLKDGLIVNCQKPDELARSIIKLIEDSELRKRISRAGYEKVKNFYNSSIFLEKVKNIYQKVLDLHNEDYRIYHS